MTFRSKRIVRIFGWVYIVAFIILHLYLVLSVFDRSLIRESDICIHLVVTLSLTFIWLLLLHLFFWEKFFATLTITNEEIRWRCMFRREICLPFDECKYVGVQLEESGNGLEYPFVYFSHTPYPCEFIGKINKLKCKPGFIKFWYSQALDNYLVSSMPSQFSSALLAYRIRSKKQNNSRRKVKRTSKTGQ